MSFLRELRRRKVYQAVAAYAVVAWVIAQLVAVVNEPLQLPGWFDTAVIVLLAIGFPITLIVSWAFELTRDGLVPDRGPDGPAAEQRHAGRWTLAAVIAVLATTLVWLLYPDTGTERPSVVANASS